MRLVFLLLSAVLGGVIIGKESASGPPIIQCKLTNVVVATTKMDEVIRFYRDVLGFKPFFQNKTSCFLKTGGANLVFVLARSADSETKKLCLDVSVPDLQTASAALRGAGMHVDATDPAILKIVDPDGNLVEIVKG